MKKTKKQKEEFSKFYHEKSNEMLEAHKSMPSEDFNKFQEDQERQLIQKYNSIYKTTIDPEKYIQRNKSFRESK